jgi:hypothetical protein
MTIKFATNVPVEVRLRSIEGRPVESQFGGVQHQFSCEEGAFYVSETVGAILTEQFRRLRVQAGEPVEICKGEVNRGNGRKGIQWIVTQVGEPPQEPKATAPSELELQLAASLAQVEARKQAPAAQPAWAETLTAQTCVLVDAFASVVKHSARYEGLVKVDDARAIFLSAFINMTKNSGNGGRNAA